MQERLKNQRPTQSGDVRMILGNARGGVMLSVVQGLIVGLPDVRNPRRSEEPPEGSRSRGLCLSVKEPEKGQPCWLVLPAIIASLD